MILSGIPFRIWEKVIKIGTIFFFLTSVVSPFFILFLYLFEADFEPLLTKNNSSPSNRAKSSQNELSKRYKNRLKNRHVPFIPSPLIKKNLVFSYHNTRPDISGDYEKELHLETTNKSAITKENEQIYITYKKNGEIEFSGEKTPYSVIPTIVSEDKVSLAYTVMYEDKDKKQIYALTEDVILKKRPAKHFSLTNLAINAKNLLSSSQYLKQDELIELFGGKKYFQHKGKARISFPGDPLAPLLYVQTGDVLCFYLDHFEKNSEDTIGKPLFQINKISNNSITGKFWNENGFYEQTITILLNKYTKANTLANFTFDHIFKGQSDSLLCKIKGKTYILKQGDWLYQKRNSWKVLQSQSELDQILTLRQPAKLLIFQNIIQKNSKDHFCGYLFDETRTTCKKLEIPLKKKRNL